MNHRYNKRYAIALDAEIKTIHGQVTTVATYDISTSGIGLTSPSRQLELNKVVQITIPVQEATTRLYKFKGMVVHLSNDRIGIMFIRHYTAAIHHLLLASQRRAKLYQSKPKPIEAESVAPLPIRQLGR